MTTKSRLQRSDSNLEGLGERLAGTSPTTPGKEVVINQNQTTTLSSPSSSKTMSPSVGAPLAVGGDKADDSHGGSSSNDKSATSGAASSSSSTTTMKPPFDTTNSTLIEEDYNENEEQEEIGRGEEERDLETSGTELNKNTKKQVLTTTVSANDSNEAQENKLSSVVADPPEQSLALISSNSNDSNHTNQIISNKNDDMDEFNESDLPDFDGVEGNNEEQQQLSRRLFLSKNKIKPNYVADEIKKLKNQGSKLLSKNPLKRKRSKKKNLAKPMRPRLGTTTVDYGNMLSAYSNNNNNNNNNNVSNQQGSPASSTTNAIANTIRQHFPAMLANPTQQLSTTVQKLIMSKLNPSASNQQAQTIAAGLQAKRPGAIMNHQLHNQVAQQLMGPNNGPSSSYQQQQQQHQQQQQAPASTSSYLDNARLVEALTQLASSNSDDSSPMSFVSSSSGQHKQLIQAPSGQQGNRMIPIEIIGLDPSVTNSILQSYDSDQAASHPAPPPLNDPMQMYPSAGGQEPALYHHQDSSNQQALAHQMQQLQTVQKAPDGLPKTYPRASSILHIHHFHTQPPSKSAVGTSGLQSVGSEAAGDQPDSGRAPSPQQAAPLPQRVIASSNAKGGQQKVYINDKGQLVYLSVEDQTEAKGGEQQDASVEQQQQQQQQQVVSDGQETRPGGDASNQLAEQQQHQQDYPQAQQDYTQQAAIEADQQQQQQHQVVAGDSSANQQEPQQVEAINLATDQPISIQSNGAFKSLLNHQMYGGQQSMMYPRNYTTRQPRVYLTSSGQTISLIGGRGNDAGMIAGGSGPAESDSDRQQFLMVAYKPQQQQQQPQQQQQQQHHFRNMTEDLLGGHRNPYSEGQESKPSFIATNHLFAGGPKLLKGGSLMLRPFPGLQQQLFVNNGSSGGNSLDDFNYELAKLRNQQHSMNLADLVARLNGTLPIGADLSHFDALRTGNKSLLLHGMLNSLASSSSFALPLPLPIPAASAPVLQPKPSLSSLPVESIPLTIVPIHQAANMSGYQAFGGASQLQENRVPFQAAATTPANPATLKALMADLTGNSNSNSNNNNNNNNNNNSNPLAIHSALLAASAAASSAANNQSRPIELASVQSSWMLPDALDKLTAASLQSNGYNSNNNNKALAAFMALRNNGTYFGGQSGLSGTTLANQIGSQNILIENLTFLKHLREVKERLKLANAEPPPVPPLISHHHLLSLNSTNKLSSDDLLSLLNELRLNNGTNTINLAALPGSQSLVEGNNLQLLEPMSSRPSKFGQPQSSSPAQTVVQAPPLPALPPPILNLNNLNNNNNNKHIRSKISNSSSSSGHNVSSSNSHGGTSDHRSQQIIKASVGHGGGNKDHRTAMESQQSDVSVDKPLPMPPIPNHVHHLDKHHQQVVSMVSADDSDFVGDTNGLGTIALAFIFISLITLTLLAASMIYRHKRRSVARCADLPSRSRLNLTQRTKHFVRSNFVNPGDVTSIKSVNGLDSGGSSSSPRSIHKRSLKSVTNSKQVSHKSSDNACELQVGSATANSALTGSENRYLAKKTSFGQPSLSTFNTNPQLIAAAAAAASGSDHKYHFSSNSSKQSSETVRTDSAATDIKTLNTRLQKPPYLKSLISTPDCLLWNTKRQQAQSNASNRSDCDTDNAAHHHHHHHPGGRQPQQHQGSNFNKVTISSPMMSASESSCKLSPSFNKKSSEGGGGGGGGGGLSETASSSSRLHQYGSPLKEIGGRLQVASGSESNLSKQQAYSNRTSRPSTTMSTIHSIRDGSDSKSGGSSSPPSQIKRQVNIIGRMGKLNNLPAPKHLQAASANALDEIRNSNSNSNSNQIDRL